MKLPKMHTSRRSFLASSLASLGVGLTLGRSMWPGVARAGVGASKRKFIFVFAQGGWDPTRVFAPEFSNPNVDLEAAAERAVAGGMGGRRGLVVAEGLEGAGTHAAACARGG